MKFLPVLLLLLTCNTFVFSQNEVCKNTLNGTVINKDDNTAVSHALVTLKIGEEVVDKAFTDANGKFSFSLKCDFRYIVSVTSENYTRNIKLVFTEIPDEVHTLKMDMIPVQEFYTKDDSKYIIADLIEFEPNSTDLTEYSNQTLQKIYMILHKYDYMVIEIGFHSNNFGKFEFLKELTQKRADVCKDFLVERGIASDRIKAVGYGFSQPVKGCDTEAMLKQEDKCTKNIRTEFKVITKEQLESTGRKESEDTPKE